VGLNVHLVEVEIKDFLFQYSLYDKISNELENEGIYLNEGLNYIPVDILKKIRKRVGFDEKEVIDKMLAKEQDGEVTVFVY